MYTRVSGWLKIGFKAVDAQGLIPEVTARRTLRGEEETKIETSDRKRELLPEGEDDEDRDQKQNYLKKKMMTMMMHHASLGGYLYVGEACATVYGH